MMGNKPVPPLDLAACLPDPHDLPLDGASAGLGALHDVIASGVIDKALPALRFAARNCPACIMSAIRLRGFHVSLATNFHYKDECDEIMLHLNLEKERERKVG